MSQDNGNWQQQVWQQPASQPACPPPVPGAFQQPAYAPPPRKSRGWIVALVAVLCVFALSAIGMVSCTSMFASSMGSLGSGGASDLDYLTGDAVAVIDIEGTIQYDGTTCSPEGLKAQLDVAADNDHVKAVVLRVDSGGGTATAGEEMA